jgi:hypothetical protein
MSEKCGLSPSIWRIAKGQQLCRAGSALLGDEHRAGGGGIEDEFVIAGGVDGALIAVLGGADEVKHLAGGYIMIIKIVVKHAARGQGGVEIERGLAEKHLAIGFGGAVGVEFDEEPIRARGDLNGGLHPQFQTSHGRNLIGLETAVFDTGEEAPFAVAPIEQEWAFDEHQRVLRARTDADVNPDFVGTGQAVLDGVIDAVDLADLGGIGGGGKGEVGIAAGLAEDIEFVVDAAPAAVGAGIVQGPVAVDEPVHGFSALAMGGEHAKAVGEEADVASELAAKIFGGVAIVMEMDFDFAVAGAA